MIKSEKDAYEIDADPQQIEDVMPENNYKKCSKKVHKKFNNIMNLPGNLGGKYWWTQPVRSLDKWTGWLSHLNFQ